MATSLVSLLIAAFVGVTSVSSTETTYVEPAVPAISMQEYDTVTDGSALEYTYPMTTLSSERYQLMLSGAFVQSTRSGSGLLVLTYSDFSCPYCQRLHDEDLVAHLRESFPGVPIKRVEKHFSIFSEPEADTSAHLAQCAGSLAGSDAYYRASDSIFRAYAGAAQAGVSLTADALMAPLARQIGVSRERLATCLQDQATKDAVDFAYTEFLSLGFQGTPSVLIIDESTLRAVAVTGAYPADYFGAGAAMLLSGTR